MQYQIAVSDKTLDGSALGRPVVQGDQNADVLVFSIPRYWGDIDLGAGAVYVRYQLPDGTGKTVLLDHTTGDDVLTAPWPLAGEATSQTGRVLYALEVVIGASVVWNTKYTQFEVAGRLNAAGASYTPDVLDRYLVIFGGLTDEAKAARDAAQLAQGAAEDARDASVAAKGVAEGARDAAVLAQGAAEGARDSAVLAQGGAESARDEAVLAQGAAEDARDYAAGAAQAAGISAGQAGDHAADALRDKGLAETARQGAESARGAAVLAQGAAEGAADRAETAEQGVADMLAGADFQAVAGVADEIAALALIKDQIVSLEAEKLKVVAVEAKLTEIQGVYAKLSAIEGVYGKSTEIDALYAQLDTIAAKANQSEVDDHESRIQVLEGFHPLESWADIRKVAKAGVASKYLKAGDLIETTYAGSPAVVEVIGINQDTPPEGTTDYKDVISFQFKDCLQNAQYSAPQALFHAVEGLVAGTYTFINSNDSLPYTFTLTQAVPAGGVVVITSWGVGTYEPTVLKTMQADRLTNIETGVAVTQASGGTALAPVNLTPRCRYGTNLYIESGIRHFLNDNSDSYVWVAQGLYDMPSTYGAGGGFLNRLDADFASVIGPVVKNAARATVDGGGQDTIEDKVWLLSRVEMGYGTEGVTTGEQVYERWNGATNAERIKLLSGSPRIWWLRPPSVSTQNYARCVNAGGTLNGSNSNSSFGLAPGLAVY